MTTSQPGVLAPVPRLARYITFSQEPETDVREALAALVEITDGERLVLGIGQSLALDLGCEVEGLRVFPAHAGPGFDVPSTQSALWCWLRGDDRGDLVHMGREVQRVAQSAFTTDEIVDAFQHGASRDLTGYEDGTENPKGDEAVAAALVAAPASTGRASSRCNSGCTISTSSNRSPRSGATTSWDAG